MDEYSVLVEAAVRAVLDLDGGAIEAPLTRPASRRLPWEQFDPDAFGPTREEWAAYRDTYGEPAPAEVVA